MTTIKITKYNNKIKEIEIAGHSMYADIGNDIVCSSISSVSYYLHLILINMGVNATVEDAQGYMRFYIKDDKIDIGHILQPFELFIRELVKQYPDNVRLNIVRR